LISETCAMLTGTTMKEGSHCAFGVLVNRRLNDHHTAALTTAALMYSTCPSGMNDPSRQRPWDNIPRHVSCPHVYACQLSRQPHHTRGSLQHVPWSEASEPCCMAVRQLRVCSLRACRVQSITTILVCRRTQPRLSLDKIYLHGTIMVAPGLGTCTSASRSPMVWALAVGCGLCRRQVNQHRARLAGTGEENGLFVIWIHRFWHPNHELGEMVMLWIWLRVLETALLYRC
jgi:hypothetical protein